MKFIESHAQFFFFVQILVGAFCAFVTVNYFLGGEVSFIRAIIFSLLVALTTVYRGRKKESRKVSEV